MGYALWNNGTVRRDSRFSGGKALEVREELSCRPSNGPFGSVLLASHFNLSRFPPCNKSAFLDPWGACRFCPTRPCLQTAFYGYAMGF